uniref:Uncharacterized protein n=1 Tax=Ditylenchus dipsaci TaxID=166011 RepID=A0A915EEN0_9BILA
MAQDDQEIIQRQGARVPPHLGFQFSNQYMITGLNNVQLPVNVEYISRDGDFAFLKSNDLPARRMVHDNFNVGEKYFLMGYPAEVLQSTPSICMGVVESFYSDVIIWLDPLVLAVATPVAYF